MDSRGGGLEALTRIQTSKRDNNGDVLKVGQMLMERLRRGQPTTNNKLVEKLITQYILDFNLMNAADKEATQWYRGIHSLTSLRGDMFGVIFKCLVTQMKTFYDEQSYASNQFKRVIIPEFKVDKQVLPPFKSIEDVRNFCAKLIQSQKLGEPFGGVYNSFLRFIVSHHPQASTKLQGLKYITVERLSDINGQFCSKEVVDANKELKGTFRALCLKYDKSQRDDGLEQDDISYMKCLNYIYDPNVDRIRDELSTYICRQFQLYIHTRFMVMLDTIKQLMPPPEFQQINGQFADPIRTQKSIQNYIHFLLSLMRKTNLQGKRAQGQQSTTFYTDSIQLYRVYKELQSILMDYLHVMETEIALGAEKFNNNTLGPDNDVNFDFWLLQQVKAFSQLLKLNPDKYKGEAKQMLEKRLHDRKLMYEQYLQHRTEDTLSGPIPNKLDNAFSAMYRFYRQEFENKLHLQVKQDVYDRHFADITRLPGIQCGKVSENNAIPSPLSPWSHQSRPASPTSSPGNDNESGGATLVGILSDDGNSSHQNDVMSVRSGDSGGTVSSKRRSAVSVTSILFSHLFDDFERCCLSSSTSPLIPTLIFGVINFNFDEFNRIFIRRLLDECMKASDVKYLERVANHLIGYSCHCATLGTAYILEIIGVLTEQLINCIRGVSHKTAGRAAILEYGLLLFSGIMEIVVSRWAELRDDFETAKLVRTVFALTLFHDRSSALKTVNKSVLVQFAKRIQKFDFSHHVPTNQFVNALKPTVSKKKKVTEPAWPIRPFSAPNELRHYKSYVSNQAVWRSISLDSDSQDEVVLKNFGASLAQRLWQEMLEEVESGVGSSEAPVKMDQRMPQQSPQLPRVSSMVEESKKSGKSIETVRQTEMEKIADVLTDVASEASDVASVASDVASKASAPPEQDSKHSSLSEDSMSEAEEPSEASEAEKASEAETYSPPPTEPPVVEKPPTEESPVEVAEPTRENSANSSVVASENDSAVPPNEPPQPAEPECRRSSTNSSVDGEVTPIELPKLPPPSSNDPLISVSPTSSSETMCCTPRKRRRRECCSSCCRNCKKLIDQLIETNKFLMKCFLDQPPPS